MALRSISDAGKNVRFDQGTHDLRNYDVRASDSEKRIGTVDDVIVDDRGRARYVCVKHDSGDKHTLIPAGSARTDRQNRRMTLSSMDRETFSNAPQYSHDPSTIDSDYERRLASAYDERTDDRFYERSDYDSRWGRGRERRHSGTLERLDKLDDYKVADGDVDPRGWKITGRDGKTLGKVDHLIGDTGSMRVRYLVVDVDSSIDKKHRNVLIPVGHVDLDSRKRHVVARGIDATCIGNMPDYTGGSISREHERNVMNACETAYENKEHRYEHPRYRDEGLWEEEAIPVAEEDLKVGTRERKAGEVGVHKSVETEHVRKPVNVHREEVEVERRPVTGDRSDKAEFKDREVRVPVTEEEVVVEKKPRVKEEVVVRKRDVEDTEYVDEKVRKERVEVDENRPRH